MYEIIISETARKEFLNLDKDMQERITLVLDRIKVRPHHFCIRLSGTLAYRLRVGKYRVILDINEKLKRVEVLRIGHRKTVYKK